MELFGIVILIVIGVIVAIIKEDPTQGKEKQVSLTKSCSHCGKGVSVSSAAGQRCPYCGAYWSREVNHTSHF
jgi:predicted RNA-binding Zn-ribbon protein involved in translation (DUF1610 family)